jgi:cell division protein ZapA
MLDIMIDPKNTYKVNIFGTEYPLKVSANVEYVQSVADYVDSKMKEIQEGKPNRPLHQVAILAALNITDELFRQREIDQQSTKHVQDQIERLTRKIKSSLQIIAEDQI